jgi:hypothetical protein
MLVHWSIVRLRHSSVSVAYVSHGEEPNASSRHRHVHSLLFQLHLCMYVTHSLALRLQSTNASAATSAGIFVRAALMSAAQRPGAQPRRTHRPGRLSR